MLVSSYILKHTIRVVHLAATYTITTHFCHPNKELLIFLCILHCAILNFVSQVTNKGLVVVRTFNNENFFSIEISRVLYGHDHYGVCHGFQKTFFIDDNEHFSDQ